MVKNIDNMFSYCDELNNILISPFSSKNVDIIKFFKQDDMIINNDLNKFELLSQDFP